MRVMYLHRPFRWRRWWRDREACESHSSDFGSFQFLPQSAKAEWAAVLHGNGIRLLGPLTLDRLPLEEAVHRNDAAPLPVSIPKGRQSLHRLAVGVDRSFCGRPWGPRTSTGLAPIGAGRASRGGSSQVFQNVIGRLPMPPALPAAPSPLSDRRVSNPVSEPAVHRIQQVRARLAAPFPGRAIETRVRPHAAARSSSSTGRFWRSE